ncbi:MAG: hypothetical protein JO347_03775 [Candidatus Eremiobacteraeota bacterium]|nr:hypothetical protein [Candidatus Eremiobacteraeota bacterium]
MADYVFSPLTAGLLRGSIRVDPTQAGHDDEIRSFNMSADGYGNIRGSGTCSARRVRRIERHRFLALLVLLLVMPVSNWALFTGSYPDALAFALSNTVILSGRASAHSAGQRKVVRRINEGVREFKIVEGNINAITIAMTSSPDGAGKLTVRELSSDGTLGPEQKMWIQHFGPGLHLDKQDAEQADILMTCHPELYDQPELLSKHVFPNARGEIGMQQELRVNLATRNVDYVLVVFQM